MKEFLRRIWFYMHRAELERELEEEMRHHLALRAEDRGSVDAARRQFGNITALREESRAVWTWTILEQLKQDVRYGVRTMAANRVFSVMAALSLALGIGANTAIYSFMDAILLRSLPVKNPGELVVLNWQSHGRPSVIHGHSGSKYRLNGGSVSPNFPFASFENLRAKPEPLSTLFAYATAWETNVVAEGQAELDEVQLVSGGFYDGLGLAPAAGRLIGDEDDRSGAPPVAVISYRFWQHQFAGNSAALGRTILLNNIPFTVIGVTPPEFFGVDPAVETRVYAPLHFIARLSPNPAEEERRKFLDPNNYWVEMMGRLRPGANLAQAQATLAPQFQEFVESTAATAKEKVDLPRLWVREATGGLDSLRRRYSKPLFILWAMTGLILIIACANIANLLLARCTARRRELAVRLSLGAGRIRVVRQLVTESVLLSLSGGILGVLVAIWGIRSITWLIANGQQDFTLHASLNWGVLGFTLALALVTGIVFGLAPAIRSTRVDLTPALKAARGDERLVRRRLGMNLSHALVIVQIAISLLLVVAAGLFGRTLSNLQSVQLGFNRENILLFSLNARQAGYKGATLAQFYSGLLDAFGRLPGVRSAALSQYPLATGSINTKYLVIPGRPVTGPQPDTAYVPVDPSFLSTLQIPIVMGRGLAPRDLSSPRVAVVTEQFARKYFPGENPVGQRVGLGLNNPADIEIVGIAKTTLYNSVKESDTPPVMYIPFTQNLNELGRAHFELRTAGDPLPLVNAVRRVVHDANASIPVSEVNTMAAQIDRTYSQERTFAYLCTSFATLALAIACVGLYGTVAYGVARRTNEIGIRMALGAARRKIVWMVLGEVLALSAVGLAIGLGLAWAASRSVESFLFGVKPGDAWSLVVSVLLLAGVAVAAGYAPAWKAARIDPMAALRHE
jgi:predicted permease